MTEMGPENEVQTIQQPIFAADGGFSIMHYSDEETRETTAPAPQQQNRFGYFGPDWRRGGRGDDPVL